MKLLNKLNNVHLYSTRLLIERLFDSTFGLFLFQYKKKDNLFNWFYNSLKYHLVQLSDTKDRFKPYNYYEFGVAEGGSMLLYMLAVKKFCRDYDMDISKFHIYGFDSFEGLPEAQEGDKRYGWSKGEMSCSSDLIEEKIKRANFPRENVHFVKGFYSESLTPELKASFKNNPPALINMDADYYSSTIQALSWMRDLLPSAALFRFDDVWAFHGHPDRGVHKAISEFNNQDKGTLTSFPILGLGGFVYIFARKEFEYE